MHNRARIAKHLILSVAHKGEKFSKPYSNIVNTKLFPAEVLKLEKRVASLLMLVQKKLFRIFIGFIHPTAMLTHSLC